MCKAFVLLLPVDITLLLTSSGTPIAISKHLVIPQAQVASNAPHRENYDPKTPTKVKQTYNQLQHSYRTLNN